MHSVIDYLFIIKNTKATFASDSSYVESTCFYYNYVKYHDLHKDILTIFFLLVQWNIYR